MERVVLKKGVKHQRGMNHRSKQDILLAQIRDGKLPKELLCTWAQDGYMEYKGRGEQEPQTVMLTPELRIAAAKAAAPFYSPTLKAVLVNVNGQETQAPAYGENSGYDLFLRRIDSLALKLERTEREHMMLEGTKTVN